MCARRWRMVGGGRKGARTWVMGLEVLLMAVNGGEQKAQENLLFAHSRMSLIPRTSKEGGGRGGMRDARCGALLLAARSCLLLPMLPFVSSERRGLGREGGARAQAVGRARAAGCRWR